MASRLIRNLVIIGVAITLLAVSAGNFSLVNGVLPPCPVSQPVTATCTLPDGTTLSVTIDHPTDGQTFQLASGTTGVDVTVDGTASIGAGPAVETTVVYVMDRSTSMNKSAGVDCTEDGTTDTRHVCERIGVAEANQAAIAAGVPLTGIADFGFDAKANDVDLGTPGTQVLTDPETDGNNNGHPDPEDVALGIPAGTKTGTNYELGLEAAFSIVNDASNTFKDKHNLIIFLSDSKDNSGAPVSSLQSQVPPKTQIKAFAIGTGVTCDHDGFDSSGNNLGSLQDVANLSTAGEKVCEEVTDMSKIGQAIGMKPTPTSLDSLSWTIAKDGGAPSAQMQIPNSGIDPDLPQPGPVTVGYSFVAADLGVGEHEICVQAHGTDSNGATSQVEACVTITVVGAPITLTGRAWGLSLEGLLTIDPTADTGPIETMEAGTVDECVANLAFPAPTAPAVAARALCGTVDTSLGPPPSSTATGSVARASVAVGLLPAILARGVESTSTTTCEGSEGSTTIAFLQIGDAVLLPAPTPIAPNTELTPGLTGIVRVVLNEQIPITDDDGNQVGLTVNAVHVTILGGVVDLILGHSESDIHGCV